MSSYNQSSRWTPIYTVMRCSQSSESYVGDHMIIFGCHSYCLDKSAKSEVLKFGQIDCYDQYRSVRVVIDT